MSHGSSRYHPATIAGVASAMTNRIGVGSSTDSAPPPRASMARTSGGGHLGLGRAAWLARSSRPLGCLVSFASPASPSFANDSRRNLGRDTAQRRLATRASVHPIIPLCLGTHVTRSRAPCPGGPPSPAGRSEDESGYRVFLPHRPQTYGNSALISQLSTFPGSPSQTSNPSPFTSSSPEPPDRVSSPARPDRSSSPEPPDRASVPLPPVRLSLPAPPDRPLNRRRHVGCHCRRRQIDRHCRRGQLECHYPCPASTNFIIPARTFQGIIASESLNDALPARVARDSLAT
jgi:hypothetical protein